MQKKTEREKMTDRNGIRKTENRKKRGLRKGSKNKRMHDLAREEQEGFYNGSVQIEQSEVRKRTRVETKSETEQQRQE